MKRAAKAKVSLSATRHMAPGTIAAVNDPTSVPNAGETGQSLWAAGGR